MKEEKANVESDLLNQNRNLTKNFAISPNSAISQKRITITAKNLHVMGHDTRNFTKECKVEIQTHNCPIVQYVIRSCLQTPCSILRWGS